EKLILGVPWYGYNYAVTSPTVKASTNVGYYQSYKRYGRTYRYYVPLSGFSETYSSIQNDITSDNTNGTYKTGWDDDGKVSYKAYYSSVDGAWRMVFVEDSKSLGLKYDFAKSKNLAGVGIWALGFDDGRNEMWSLLGDEFGTKLADSSVINKDIIDE